MVDLGGVQTAVLEWYAVHGRNLPWRRTRDPYAILVAEVMLQQTQVERVIPKWHEWLARFPTLADLAVASRADAIRAWQGLGYNLRAVRLHAIARQCVEEFEGRVPASVEMLLRLKGIGPYTAGAVACFAYEQPVPMVDTNIRRVLGRVFQVDDVEAMAGGVVPAGKPYAWNQALMDIGATLCRPRDPLCLLCPLREQCAGPRPSAPRSKPQGTFWDSNRYHRGRILDTLRSTPEGLSVAHFRSDLVEDLVRDGLIELDGEGRVRLPV